MNQLTLLTNPVETHINGKNTQLFVVQGLKFGSTVLRAACVEAGIPDQKFVNDALPFEMRGVRHNERLRRIVDFFADTQVSQRVRGYTDHTFVSYVMGWSSSMDRSNLHNTGLPGYSLGKKVEAGEAQGIVRHADRMLSVAPIRGSLKLSALGVDGSDKLLTIPRENQPLVVIGSADALRCYGGNKLYMLRKEG